MTIYAREKLHCYRNVGCGVVSGGEFTKQRVTLNKTSKKASLTNVHLKKTSSQKKWNFFDHAHCDIEVPESLRSNFANLPLILKNILVSEIEIRVLMENYAEEEGLLF